MKVLFKDKYYDEYLDSFSRKIIIYSQNSAVSVLLIWKQIESEFYDVDIKELIDKYKSNLGFESLKKKLTDHEIILANEFTKDSRYQRLVNSFYEYYTQRLPVLREIRSYPNYKCLSTFEINEIRTRSFYMMYKKNDLNVYESSYTRFMCFTKMPKLIRSRLRKRFDDEVYNDSLFWEDLEEIYPEFLVRNNITRLVYYVIRDSFPMFWDSFSSEIAFDLKHAIWGGHVRGTKDTDELIESMKDK